MDIFVNWNWVDTQWQ